jgi:Holliday junction resolvasome RuvABC endonuclease subunit
VRVVGIDIAGVGYAAAALVVNGNPTEAAVCKFDKRDAEPTRLLQWSRWLDFKFALWKPDLISVEELAVFLNKKVIRSLSKMEGVALLQAKKRSGAILVNPPITVARSIVFKDQGVRSKEDAFIAFKKKYPNFKLPAANAGGMDVADAVVHGVAAPVIIERRR